MPEQKLRFALTPLAAGLMLALSCAMAQAQEMSSDSDSNPNPDDAMPVRKVTINEFIVRGNTVLDARAIERAVTPHLGPDRTPQDVEAARNALQAAYQERGYQSVYVDVPEQQVVGGVVFLQVNETRVGRVEITGARYNDPETLRERVPALQPGAVPDFNRAQQELTELNRTAKRQVIPLVRQSQVAGMMDVELKVEDESPWRFHASLNNDRSLDTSSYRSVLTVGHDNLWQKGHVASLTFFTAPEKPSEAKVWSGSYALPLAGPDWMLEFSGYKSDSDVLSAGSTNVTGRGHSLGIKLSRTLPASGKWWHQLSAGIDFKNMDEQVSIAGMEAQYVPLKYAPITLAYNGFLQDERHQIGTGLQLVFGTRNFLGYGSDTKEFDWKRYKADPSFAAVRLDLSDTLTMQSGAQWFGRFSAQLTDDPLVSSEQLAAGGMYTVRGYLSAEALGDYGALGTLEWRTRPMRLGPLQESRLYAFLDGAWLKLHAPLPETEREFSLASLGVGGNFRLFDHVHLRLDYGHTLNDGPSTRRGEGRLLFSLGANF
ncbi:MAG: hypothetical protein LBB55_07210 [Zoogloeaceae bacterium]|jgi:hemolysin activation/secretion protein|nr:hypothetical protein [Zoogloeaceae bacterium]